MHIYCDESGGVGRGVMTLAGLRIEAHIADEIITHFRDATGFRGEVKGSRIDLAERALLFEYLGQSDIKAVVGIAISAVKPEQGEDRGDHDVAIYGGLMRNVVGSLLSPDTPCISVVMDDGRYGPEILAQIRADIADLVGPFGLTKLELSHQACGLQLADVVANSFFNRALPNDRQAKIAAIIQPLLDSGQIVMQVMSKDAAG